MNKIKSILFVLCFVMFTSIAFGASGYTSENIVILGPEMGSIGMTPPTEIIRVSTGSDDSCAIGDVMMWDTAGAATHGFSVRRCTINDGSEDYDTALATRSVFAGVMVTTTSKDSAVTYNTVAGDGPEVGFMAIRGYCEAFCDANTTEPGERLVLKGSNDTAKFGTVDYSVNRTSYDIGVCLENPTSDSVAVDVWLK